MDAQEMRSTFGRLVSPDTIDKLVSGESIGGIGRTEARNLQIVMVLVSDTETDVVPYGLATVAELAKEHGADFHSITCNLVTLSFGLNSEGRSDAEKRIRFVEGLQQRLGRSVRIVHGPGAARVGLQGGQTFCFYSFLVPQFTRALSMIVNLEDGGAREVSFG